MLRLAAVLGLLSLASCLSENAIVFDPGRHGPIEGVAPGQNGDEVLQVLGPPDARASGWWSGANRFDINYVVWYYKDKGRVVMDGWKSRTVVTSEADPEEDGRP